MDQFTSRTFFSSHLASHFAMLQANSPSPKRLTPNNHAADDHGQRTLSPGTFPRAGLYPVAPAVGQRSHARPSNPTPFTVPRNMDSSMDRIPDLPPGQLSELMQSGRPWWARELGLGKEPGRSSHQRESSLTSTLGSTGPNSPCSPNMPTPHIAVGDPADDAQGNGSWNYHFVPEPAPLHQDQLMYTGPQFYGLQMDVQSGKSPYAPDSSAGNRATEPPPGMDPPYSSAAHQSIPMTSSASAPMANFTPGFQHDPSGLQQGGESLGRSGQRQGKGAASPWALLHTSSQADDFTAVPDVPKLDRTMTDIYNDNLYNPNLDIISSASPSAAPSSPSDDIFSQRLDATGSLGNGHQHHGVAGHVPVAPPSHTGDAGYHRTPLFDASDAHTPQTISPQDSMLDFPDADGGSSNFPLFPRSEPNRYGGIDAMSEGGFSHGNFEGGSGEHSLPYMPTDSSSTLFAPHDFTVFGTRQDLRPSMRPGGDTGTAQRPAENNNSGTYSCTYHGCTQRFDTPSLLQKHKREGHRQANSLKTSPRGGSGKTSAMDTQAGPHRCFRTNPGTGKVCKAVFSRPYDLTRHEDTIHNARKQKVRCDLCTEEKLFSRADALTRHYRVCHPDVELPNKHKRRRPGSQS